MSSLPENSLPFQVDENITFTEDPKAFRTQLTTVFQKLSNASNSKDVGLYDELEMVNGQQFFGQNTQEKRAAYRKCFQFGAIAAGATLNIAHDIGDLTQITRLYGTVITVVVDQRPIPYSSVTAANQGIELLLVGANISIINGAAAPNITSGLLVCEYLKN